MVSLVRCIASKKNHESSWSSSSPCQLLEVFSPLPPPSLPSLPVGGLLIAGMASLCPCATVEVYCSETSQWYTADPLPAPYYWMSSVTIADTCYLLGGCHADVNPVATVLYASLSSLIQKATSFPRQSTSSTSVWKTLPDTPLIYSTAVSLSGQLVAIGRGDGETASPEVYVFFPLNNSWVRIMTGDLPQPQGLCTAVQLSSNTVMVIGGAGNAVDSVLIGTITI